jgi:hypothetical protein
MPDTERPAPALPRWTRYAVSLGAGYILWALTSEKLGIAAITLGVVAAVCLNALLGAWRSSR